MSCGRSMISHYVLGTCRPDFHVSEVVCVFGTLRHEVYSKVSTVSGRNYSMVFVRLVGGPLHILMAHLLLGTEQSICTN